MTEDRLAEFQREKCGCNDGNVCLWCMEFHNELLVTELKAARATGGEMSDAYHKQFVETVALKARIAESEEELSTLLSRLGIKPKDWLEEWHRLTSGLEGRND